ncbi:MAG: hypothetical protein AAF862_11405 [Pseudomonadota bacterium]
MRVVIALIAVAVLLPAVLAGVLLAATDSVLRLGLPVALSRTPFDVLRVDDARIDILDISNGQIGVSIRDLELEHRASGLRFHADGLDIAAPLIGAGRLSARGRLNEIPFTADGRLQAGQLVQAHTLLSFADGELAASFNANGQDSAARQRASSDAVSGPGLVISATQVQPMMAQLFAIAKADVSALPDAINLNIQQQSETTFSGEYSIDTGVNITALGSIDVDLKDRRVIQRGTIEQRAIDTADTAFALDSVTQGIVDTWTYQRVLVSDVMPVLQSWTLSLDNRLLESSSAAAENTSQPIEFDRIVAEFSPAELGRFDIRYAQTRPDADGVSVKVSAMPAQEAGDWSVLEMVGAINLPQQQTALKGILQSAPQPGPGNSMALTLAEPTAELRIAQLENQALSLSVTGEVKPERLGTYLQHITTVQQRDAILKLSGTKGQAVTMSGAARLSDRAALESHLQVKVESGQVAWKGEATEITPGLFQLQGAIEGRWKTLNLDDIIDLLPPSDTPKTASQSRGGVMPIEFLATRIDVTLDEVIGTDVRAHDVQLTAQLSADSPAEAKLKAGRIVAGDTEISDPVELFAQLPLTQQRPVQLTANFPVGPVSVKAYMPRPVQTLAQLLEQGIPETLRFAANAPGVSLSGSGRYDGQAWSANGKMRGRSARQLAALFRQEALFADHPMQNLPIETAFSVVQRDGRVSAELGRMKFGQARGQCNAEFASAFAASGACWMSGPLVQVAMRAANQDLLDLVGPEQSVRFDLTLSDTRLALDNIDLGAKNIDAAGTVQMPINAQALVFNDAEGELVGTVRSTQRASKWLKSFTFSLASRPVSADARVIAGKVEARHRFGPPLDIDFRTAVDPQTLAAKTADLALKITDLDLQKVCEADIDMFGRGTLNADLSGSFAPGDLISLLEKQVLTPELMQNINAAGRLSITDGSLLRIDMERRANGDDASVGENKITPFDQVLADISVVGPKLTLSNGQLKTTQFALDVSGEADIPSQQLDMLISGDINVLSKRSTGEVLVKAAIVPVRVAGRPGDIEFVGVPGSKAAISAATSVALKVKAIDDSLTRTQKKVDSFFTRKFFRPLLNKEKPAEQKQAPSAAAPVGCGS